MFPAYDFYIFFFQEIKHRSVLLYELILCLRLNDSITFQTLLILAILTIINSKWVVNLVFSNGHPDLHHH
jgi:hypothetical protein